MARTGTPPNLTPLPSLPPTAELFTRRAFAQRHPNLLNDWRVEWATRNRATNGLNDCNAVFESRGSGGEGELLIHEPAFLAWFLGLTGRAKPRALRNKARRRGAKSARRLTEAEVR